MQMKYLLPVRRRGKSSSTLIKAKIFAFSSIDKNLLALACYAPYLDKSFDTINHPHLNLFHCISLKNFRIDIC